MQFSQKSACLAFLIPSINCGWWGTPRIPALWWWGQMDPKFKVIVLDTQ